MEQTSTSVQHIPMWNEIMTMIYETGRITREQAEDFDRRMKEDEQARLKSREDFDRRMKEEEQARKKSREDFDRRMKEEEQARKKSREDFDRRMKEEEQARLKSREDFDRRMKEEEQARKKSREDFDRRMKEDEQARLKSREDFDRRMKESDEKFERSLQASREDFDRRMKEEEQARLKSREDFDRRMKEEEQARQKYREEYERESKKTDKIIRKMSENFISQSGHIVEGLMEPCAMKIFQDYGFDLDKCWKNMEGRDKTTGREMEVDLFLHDTTDSVAVEVKIHCTKKKIVHFLEQMQMFKQIFTEFAHNKIYVAVAAINFDKEAVAYAKDKGVFLIHCNDDVFTLEPVDKEKLLTF